VGGGGSGGGGGGETETETETETERDRERHTDRDRDRDRGREREGGREGAAGEEWVNCEHHQVRMQLDCGLSNRFWQLVARLA
jgi:hypothetical protein